MKNKDKNKWPVVCPKCRGVDAERAYCKTCKGSGMAKDKSDKNKFRKAVTTA